MNLCHQYLKENTAKLQSLFCVPVMFSICTEGLLLMLLLTTIIIVMTVEIHNHFLKPLTYNKIGIHCTDLFIYYLKLQNEQS
jgi:hypothetical protein